MWSPQHPSTHPLDKLQLKGSVEIDCSPLSPGRSAPSRDGITVYGWPSSGGIWVREDCDVLELDFLGVPTSGNADTQRFSEAENAFCQRLEWIGARWYESDVDYDFVRHAEGHLLRSYYAWPGAVPADGVWALWLDGAAASLLDADRISNASTMQDRRDVIQSLGGRFYQDWKDLVPDIGRYMSEETEQMIRKASQDGLDRIDRQHNDIDS